MREKVLRTEKQKIEKPREKKRENGSNRQRQCEANEGREEKSEIEMRCNRYRFKAHNSAIVVPLYSLLKTKPPL